MTGKREKPELEGDMYLFREPELLDVERHGGMGLAGNARPFEFAADAYVIPIVVSEILSVQKHYPVVFSSEKDPVLFAVVGFEGGPNLFVDANGGWEPGCYIPAYLRSYPFTFAEAPDDKIAIVIDRSSPAVSESPTEPFFESGKLSRDTQAKVDVFSQLVVERHKTRAFCEQVRESGLLSGQQASQRSGGTEEILARFTAVDAARLEALDAEKLWEVHTRGLLAAIYAHIFSLENWTALIERRQRQAGAFHHGA